MVRRRLIERMRDQLPHPGERFLSNRAVARQYGISYQTAHLLLASLQEEGHLRRRGRSGTYLSGRRAELTLAHLLFHDRARRKESFGARLLALIRRALSANGIDTVVSFMNPAADPQRIRLRRGALPVLWECPGLPERCARDGRYALLLNDRPAPGVAATRIDSVGVDDFSGGACAAELLAAAHVRAPRVLAGPVDDWRSRQRVRGFLSVLDAQVLHADGWFMDDGHSMARRILAAGVDGVFCCNDRLAEGLVRFARTHNRPLPRLVGFDDAPVSAELQLTTIAIPWGQLAQSAVDVIAQRLQGSTRPAIHQHLPPHPVRRMT
jgi:DNA-binding LacI/PurR family transcriptional regulator